MSVEAEYEAELVVDRRTIEADGVVALALRHPRGDELPAWEAGAHVDLLLEDGLTRQYSLCGDVADRHVWRIAVLHEPAGRGGSAFVHTKLAEGSRVRVRGPRNHFPLRPAPRYLFIAGGIGITPILPMIAAATASGAEWTLLYGGRTRASMAFRDEFGARDASVEDGDGHDRGHVGEDRHREPRSDRVLIHPQDEHGLLDLAAHLAEPSADTLVYCCGPEPLLAAVENHCATWPPGSLVVERFQPRAVDPDAVSAAFDVVLARSGKTVNVPADASILASVQAAGVQVLFSCTEGTCGTCETDVLEGVPDHRDSVLTDEEQAAGETMMICVSRCRGDRLVLDL